MQLTKKNIVGIPTLPTTGLASNPTHSCRITREDQRQILFFNYPFAICNLSAKVGNVALMYYLLTSQNRRLDLFSGTNKLRSTFAGCTRNLHYKLYLTHKLINSIVQRSSILHKRRPRYIMFEKN